MNNQNNSNKSVGVSAYSLETKSAQELKGYYFWIPSYQRGYRWTQVEVEKLLDDLYQFSLSGMDDGRSYCLQPLVVFANNERKAWEVIDGQQRLTTIYLILKRLKPKLDLFSISYETRDGSAEFLKNLEPWLFAPESNIDYYHISQAWTAIGQWFDENRDVTAEDRIKFALLSNVKFIWYEIKDELDVRMEVFNRLNIGKIPLTNAELIKALLLQKENFPIAHQDRVIEELNKEKQNRNRLDLARQWDEIERELRDEEFWAFVNGKNSDFPTRIELILRLVVEKKGKTSPQSYAVFEYYEKEVVPSDDPGTRESLRVMEVWKEVLKVFRLLKEWYLDPNGQLYHLTAYSIAYTPIKVVDLLCLAEGKRKSKFVQLLKKKIVDDLRIKNASEILEFSYDSDGKAVEKVLVLFNISVVQKMAGGRERLSFHQLNSQDWSLEHIHAQNSEDLIEKQQWIEWLRDHREALVALRPNSATPAECSALVTDIDRLLANQDFSKNEFKPVYDKVVGFFSQGPSGFDIHDIGNLALLDKDTNSALSNSVFEVKNRKIKARIFNGVYVLPGTRNVFQKYYSKHAGSLYYWNEQDQKDYRDVLVEHLNALLMGETK